ncbi:MAG: HAMP domain-containing protein [Anaerolineales bacterium]|nr:HAMP domain-containing protein [Anaerolineales bacterium]
MKYINEHLGAKIFFSNILVIAIGVVVLLIATELAVPAAFQRHMGQMDMSTMQGMGLGNGNGRGGMNSFFQNFRASVTESLAIATTASVVAALLVSLFISRRIVAPVQTLNNASQHIADGQFDKRVEVTGEDELAQLAASFNQMASQLEEVENKRRQLIGDVTHELRTPLTSIKGYMEGLVDGVLPATPETYNQIHNEASRLARLVDDLQELSRVEASAFSLDIRPADISQLVGTILKRLSPQATTKRITLRSNLPANLGHVLADEDRITQVLTNLVANALQYTPEDGIVTISAIQKDDEVQVSVKDSGIGIPPEHLPNVFTRFYRVDKSRSRNAGGGSGIGLTIARHLIEAHGGRIWVESEGEGKGSTFSFNLKIQK